MKKIAIIGASYLQEPLIQKAKEMGIETHVFAWAADDVGEKSADYFYPISIVEKEEILKQCRAIGIDGICSIGSDLAVGTVNYVAQEMGLTGNSIESTELSTNKRRMRQAFYANGDPAPESRVVHSSDDLEQYEFAYPVVVKPVDRSGSRGITKVCDKSELSEAVRRAESYGFVKDVLVEEFAAGTEYSVECISYQGKHTLLAVTKKYTTGSPGFIETGHIQPADITEEMLKKVRQKVFHALSSLKIEYGASHSELKIDRNGHMKFIEIGARMGGDFIGSTLVHSSTGIDFVKAVLQIALGKAPDLRPDREKAVAGVHFIFSPMDVETLKRLREEHPEYLVEESVAEKIDGIVTESATRFGYYIMEAPTKANLLPYMPEERE